MWSVMMVAMMAPSVAPTLATFARVTRERRNRAAVHSALPAFFTSGYLLIWVAFSALATGLQWALTAGGQLTAHAALESATLQGAVLLAAGLFQLTPIKEACLRQCQSPLGFLLGHWQEGRGGALRMGLRHGLFCLGCCWALMLLMFVGGTMSLIWMAGLAAFVLLEKLALRFPWFPRATGVALVFAGIGVLLRGTVLATG